MTRLVLFIGLGLWLCSSNLFAQGKTRDCPTKKQAQFRLHPGEFTVTAYDARRGLLALSGQFELQRVSGRPYPLTLVMPQKTIYLAIGPEHLKLWIEDGKEQADLIVDAQYSPLEAHGPTRPTCDRWTVQSVRLQRGPLILANQKIFDGSRRQARPKVTSKLVIESGQIGQEKVEDIGRALAVQCLKEFRQEQFRIQGALSFQLEMDILGQNPPPSIVVDGLVNHPLSQCLKARLAGSETLWQKFKPASRGYLTVYFQTADSGSENVRKMATPTQ